MQTLHSDDPSVHRGLAMLGIALGVAQVVAPRKVADIVGVDVEDSIVRLLGVREIASGIAILSSHRPDLGLWSRVAGDVMDLMTLTAAARSPNVRKARAALSVASVLGLAAIDVVAAKSSSSNYH